MKPQMPVVKRRDLITSAGTMGFFSGLAGCSAHTSSGSSASQTANETATGTEIDTVTPPPSAGVQAAIEETRTELTAAFETIHSMEFHRGDKTVADPEKFKQYDYEEALSYVKNARESLATVDQHADNKRLKIHYGVLVSLANLCEEGALLYDNLRKTFREGWQYEYAHKKAAYKEAVKEISEARRFIAKLRSYREEVADTIESIARAPVDPEVDGFNLHTWADIEATIKDQVPALSATFTGFEKYSEAVVYDYQGRDALDNDESEAAYNLFQTAINKVNESKASLSAAKQRNAFFFDKRLNMYFCEAPGMKQAYTFHLMAANAHSEGDDEKAAEFKEKGTDKIVETIKNCQES